MVLTSNHPSLFQSLGIFEFGDFAGAVADEAVDQRDVRAVVVAFDAIGHGDIFRHEDVRFDSGGGGVSGERSRGVARRGDREFLRAEVTRHGHAGGEAARLERSGGVEAFVLDIDVGIFAAEQHGREAFAE